MAIKATPLDSAASLDPWQVPDSDELQYRIGGGVAPLVEHVRWRVYGSFLACAYRAPSSLGPVLDRTEMTLTIQRLLEWKFMWKVCIASDT